jgi:hypothetical protein
VLEEDMLRPEALDQTRIEQLVEENLHAQLQVVEERELANALHEFVDKVPSMAMHFSAEQELLQSPYHAA